MEHWIISASVKLYNHIKAFDELEMIDWRQSANCCVGDIIYIYTTAPYKRIMFKTHIEKTDILFDDTIDDRKYWVDKNEYKRVDGRKYMRLVLDEKYNDDRLSLDMLHQHGLNGNIQGPRRLNDETLKYIESCIGIEKNFFPETDVPTEHWEGTCVSVTVNKYERNAKARQECIDEYGCKCSICGLDFEKMYGEVGKGFIHVHHIVPISEIGKEYKLNPKTDLIPVCPNCHAMLHRKINGKTLSCDELRKLIKKD